MKEPIRVLQVLGTTGLGGAKAGSWIYTGISTVRGCSLILQCTPQKGYFDEEIEALGGHIYRLPRFPGL